MVLDTRPAAQFGAGHVPGSIHIALSGQYASWAGTLIGLAPPIILGAEDAERLEESRTHLARVGIENVVGYLAEGVLAWERSGMPLEQVPQISVLDLYENRSCGHVAPPPLTSASHQILAGNSTHTSHTLG